MEVVHFFDNSKQIKIYSVGNKFHIETASFKEEVVIKISFVENIAVRFRLLRRFMRLDKSNCFPLFYKNEMLESVIIIYRHNVYLWKKNELVRTLNLKGCRNVMQQSIAEAENGFIYFGEYANNAERKKVPIYRSIDRGRSWHKVYNFNSGEIKHVHAIQWDCIEKKLWVCTGDKEGECKIVVSDLEFNDIEILGDGSQKWRTCNFIFENSYVIWGMDSPLTECFMVKLNRKTRELEKLSKVSGPVWYGRKWSEGRYLISTSVEPGINCLDNKSKVYISDDLHQWDVLWEFDKDFYHPIYFKFGSILFSNGNEGGEEFYMSFDAIKGFDGNSILVSNDGFVK